MDPITDYARIEQAIRYLDRERSAAPSLADVAAHVGLSESHFQRMFTRWAGISPKRLVQYRTAEVIKRVLRARRPVLEATYEAGRSGPGRLYDLVVNAEAVTPGESQRGGLGVRVQYGFHPTPFGECLIALTARGICHLAFVAPIAREEALARLARDWPSAELEANQAATRTVAAQAFPPPGSSVVPSLTLHVKGTNFQLKVWKALLDIPSGEVTTYGAIATQLGDAKAARAVGAAVGANPVSYLIPCHRVIRASGEMGGYAWGVDRKRVMLARETSLVGLGTHDCPSAQAATRPARSATIPPAARRASAGGAPPARSA